MALKVGMKMNGTWYSKDAPSTDWDQCLRACEQFMRENPGVQEMELFESNLHGRHGKWTLYSYKNGQWYSHPGPPKRSSAAW
jgi:hypothetical protein